MIAYSELADRQLSIIVRQMMAFSDSNHCSASLRARIEGGEFVRLPTTVNDEISDR